MEAMELRRELQRQMINEANMEEKLLRQKIKDIENGQIMRGEAIGYFGGDDEYGGKAKKRKKKRKVRGGKESKMELKRAHELAALHNPFVQFMEMYGLNPHEAAQLYHGMGYGTQLGAVHNPYLEYLKTHHTRKGYNKESPIHLQEHGMALSGGRRRRGGTAKQKAAAKKNKWLKFIKKHEGSGKTLKQLSKMYHKKK